MGWVASNLMMCGYKYSMTNFLEAKSVCHCNCYSHENISIAILIFILASFVILEVTILILAFKDNILRKLKLNKVSVKISVK